MGYIQGESRDQVTLFPEIMDHYISEDNLVRFIDAFVDDLDMLQLGFNHSITSYTGRYPFDPKDMLKLYIYCYVIKIRSSRRIEEETHRNIELMWLIRKLKPDYKTISNFKKDNCNILKKVFKEFVFLCKSLELFGEKLIAVDGSKFKAVNSKDNCFTSKQIQKNLQKIEEDINKYLKDLNTKDKEEDKETEIRDKKLQEKIKSLQQAKNIYKELEKKMNESGESQISLTDSDSRLMKTRHGNDVCYNVQVAADEKHKLIVDFDVTNDCNDTNQLNNISTAAKETLGVEKIDVLADTGYFSNKEIKDSIDNGITPYIPEPLKNNSSEENKKYCKDNFLYNKEKDVYVCPNNCELAYRENFKDKKTGEKYKIYRTNSCKNCPIRKKCTDDLKRGRKIQRWVDEHLIEEMKSRCNNEIDKTKQRKEIIEHIFGTIKRGFNQGHFLTIGSSNVTGEFSLTALSYNIIRVANIIGIKKMIKAIS